MPHPFLRDLSILGSWWFEGMGTWREGNIERQLGGQFGSRRISSNKMWEDVWERRRKLTMRIKKKRETCQRRISMLRWAFINGSRSPVVGRMTGAERPKVGELGDTNIKSGTCDVMAVTDLNMTRSARRGMFL